MKVDNCYQLGEIVKTHGLKGEVILHLDVDQPAYYNELESVFLKQDGRLVPFFITKIQVQGSSARVKFDEIDSIDSAKSLTGTEAFLPLDALPPLESGAYYLHDLLGLTVLLKNKEVGVINELYDLESNPMFGYLHDGKEVLVPIHDDFLTQVNPESGNVHISLPEGYLEIYLHS